MTFKRRDKLFEILAFYRERRRRFIGEGKKAVYAIISLIDFDVRSFAREPVHFSAFTGTNTVAASCLSINIRYLHYTTFIVSINFLYFILLCC